MSTLTISVPKRWLHSSAEAIFACLIWPPLPGKAADPDAIESLAKAMSNCAGQLNILGFSGDLKRPCARRLVNF